MKHNAHFLYGSKYIENAIAKLKSLKIKHPKKGRKKIKETGKGKGKALGKSKHNRKSK